MALDYLRSVVFVHLLRCVFSGYCLHNYIRSALYHHSNVGRIQYPTHRDGIENDALFFPPGCSSAKVVTSYMLPLAMIHMLAGPLCVATSEAEYFGYTLGAGSFDNGVMNTGVGVPLAGIVDA